MMPATAQLTRSTLVVAKPATNRRHSQNTPVATIRTKRFHHHPPSQSAAPKTASIATADTDRTGRSDFLLAGGTSRPSSPAITPLPPSELLERPAEVLRREIGPQVVREPE